MLYENRLSGTIPASLGSMDKLIELYVRLCDVMPKQGIGSRVGDELRSAVHEQGHAVLCCGVGRGCRVLWCCGRMSEFGGVGV